MKLPADQKPKTTVIIPVYNSEEYLAQTLDCVLAQTQTEIEVILVDDGSTDSSLDIERAYAERDPRVRIIQQPNLRQGTARNRGLAEARGEYVYFMDSDDLIVPDAFEACYAACKTDDLDFVTFDSAGFIHDPEVERAEYFPELRSNPGKLPCEVMDGVRFWIENAPNGDVPWICWLQYFKRDFLLQNDLRFVEGIYFEDNDWICRVYLAAKRLRYLPRKLHRYRARPGSNVHSGFKEVLAWSCFDVFRIMLEIRAQQTTPERIRMAEDILNGICVRWQQFGQLEPVPALVERAVAFRQELIDVCESDDAPVELKRIHLRALLSLMAGMAPWAEASVSDGCRDRSTTSEPGYSIPAECGAPVDRRLVDTILLGNLPDPDEAPCLGLYGTGKACSLLMKYWTDADRDDPESSLRNRRIIFLETDPAPGKTFLGQPVYGIKNAITQEIDAIIITSEKFAEQIRRTINAVMREPLPVSVLTRYILALEALELGARLD